jgi:tRNA pseudouridine65 synthase
VIEGNANPTVNPPEPWPFPLLLQNGGVSIIAKPSGLVVHRGHSGDRDSVVDRLRQAGLGSHHPAHRLDRGTSGCLLLVNDPVLARFFGDAFTRGLVKKTYYALVRGVAPEDTFVDHPIPKDEGGERVPAQTRILRRQTVGPIVDSPLREQRYSWVEARPETGRYHQVRRHLAHLHHPIIGDANYGKGEHNRFCRERFGLARLALHAASLTLPLPDGSTLTCHAPLPTDLVGSLHQIGVVV